MRDTCGKPPSMPFTVAGMVFQYSREEAWLMFESGVDVAATVDVEVVEEGGIVNNSRRGDCCDRSD